MCSSTSCRLRLFPQVPWRRTQWLTGRGLLVGGKDDNNRRVGGCLDPNCPRCGPPTLAQMTRRLGLLGGTFDPPHLGHLAAARAVRAALGLDEVKLVVANDPWQKSAVRPVTPAPIRLEMTRALVEQEQGLGVEECEIVRGGPSYTVDTLAQYRAREPETELFLIVGSDAAAGICSWHRATELAGLSTLVVVNRPADTSAVPACVPPDRCVFVAMDPVSISSTQVREAVAGGGNVGSLTGEAVAAVIRRHRLYGAAA